MFLKLERIFDVSSIKCTNSRIRLEHQKFVQNSLFSWSQRYLFIFSCNPPSCALSHILAAFSTRGTPFKGSLLKSYWKSHWSQFWGSPGPGYQVMCVFLPDIQTRRRSHFELGPDYRSDTRSIELGWPRDTRKIALNCEDMHSPIGHKNFSITFVRNMT
jgi:hypothetical protein